MAGGGWDPAARYRLDPDVALRPEPFGALAYHYGSRRLTFLRDRLLVDVVRSLAEYPSATAAVDDLVPERRRPAFTEALAGLAASQFILAEPAVVAEPGAEVGEPTGTKTAIPAAAEAGEP